MQNIDYLVIVLFFVLLPLVSLSSPGGKCPTILRSPSGLWLEAGPQVSGRKHGEQKMKAQTASLVKVQFSEIACGHLFAGGLG